MNAQLQPKLAPVPATESPATAALRTAREAHASVADRLNAINAEMQAVEQAAAPAASAASAATTLRAQRTSIIGRMLRLGRVDPRTPELRALDREIATGEEAERQAAAIAEAKREAIAELQAEADLLHPKLKLAAAELAVAQLGALGEQISGELLPAIRAAAAQLTADYGALAGAGQAHTEMARRLREQFGISVSSLGTDRPPADIDLPVIGFGVADNGRTNVMHTDARTAIEAGRAAALRCWKQV